MEPSGDPSDSETQDRLGLSAGLGSAVLFCENCREETPHRLLRLKPTSGSSPLNVTGVARCRVCRWTHPFRSSREPLLEVAVIVSDGGKSERRRITIPRNLTVRVGASVPDGEEPLRITRIDTSEQRSVESSPARKVGTLWAIRGNEVVVPVSIVEGARTSARVLRVPPSSRLAVGETLDLDGDRIVIVGLRARGRTWRLGGDGFPASEVQRVYGRRTLRPPAGKRDWRTDRGIPRSRASSTSLAARSRSSPGVRRTTALPRAAIADRGARTQRSSPS